MMAALFTVVGFGGLVVHILAPGDPDPFLLMLLTGVGSLPASGAMFPRERKQLDTPTPGTLPALFSQDEWNRMVDEYCDQHPELRPVLGLPRPCQHSVGVERIEAWSSAGPVRAACVRCGKPVDRPSHASQWAEERRVLADLDRVLADRRHY